MALIRAERLDPAATAYRLFTVTRDKTPWVAAALIRATPFTTDPDRAHLAWRTASRGFYAEQAGLVAAATLAAHTDDVALRLSLALATADEARHAEAFLQYATALGGEPDDCVRDLEPLDRALTDLPHMGRVLVHTMLEGFAADEFILLREVFAGDPLADLYHHVRRDEIQHVAIGLDHLARTSATPAGRDLWHAHAAGWHDTALALTHLDAMSASLADLTDRDPHAVRRWFLRRHHARLHAAGITLGEEVNDHDDQEGEHQAPRPRHLQVRRPDQQRQQVT